MRKVITLDEYFPTGEATIQPAVLVGLNGRPLREQVTKTASEASDYIKHVKPVPGKSLVLVLGLGAYETYDLNQNGDGFNEHPYKQGYKPSCGCCSAPEGWVSSKQVVTQHYKTFETHATVYKHHRNKDPSRNFGDVVKAFWNSYMKRVELLLGVDNEKAPDIVERIADGEFPAVSMGCRIKYDVCTICGHQARTRAQYCDHLKFGMRQVTSSGLRAGALNPDPVFFDISFVIRPADKTGYMMKKVARTYEVRPSAEMGEYLDNLELKQAALKKLSDIDKVVRGQTVDFKTSPLTEQEAKAVSNYRDTVQPAVNGMPALDAGLIRDLAQYPLADVLTTLAVAGVMPSTAEFIQLVAAKMAPGTQVPEEALNRAVELQGSTFDLFAEHPQLLDELLESGIFDLNKDHVRPEIGRKAEKYLEKRSTISDYLMRTMIPAAIRTEEPNWTDELTVTDPATGARYSTTRGAAKDAHDAIAKKQLAKIVGGGALLAGAHKVVSSGIPAALRPLSLGTAGVIGLQTLKPNWGPHYMTDQGVPVSMLTEMRKVGSHSHMVPYLGTAALIAALSYDYGRRLRKGMPPPDKDSPLSDQAAYHLGSFSHDHPLPAYLGGVSAYGLGKNLVRKLAEEDGVHLPPVDLDEVAEKLGFVLLG